MKQEYDIFISYSRQDIEIVKSLVAEIHEKTNARCWVDWNGIECGEQQFVDVIVKAIDNVDVVLFVLSDYSMSSRYVKKEIAYARNTGKRVVPVVVDAGKLRGWFLFEFGQTDYISLGSKLQCDKLIRNIEKWYGNKPVLKTDITDEPVVGETVVEELLIEEAAVEESLAEEGVVDEPIIEELLIEEPTVEESLAEEGVVDEPAAEESMLEELLIEEAAVEESLAEEGVVDEPIIEELLIEEPTVEESLADEAVVDEPAAEESMVEELLIEEAAVEESLAEEGVVNEPIIEELLIEEPTVEESLAEEGVVDEPIIEELLIEEPTVEESLADEAVVDEPAAEESMVEELLIEEAAVEESLADEAVVDEPAAEESMVEELLIEEAAVEESLADEAVVDKPAAEESMVEELLIEEASVEESLADEAVVDEPAAEESIVEEPVVEELVVEGSFADKAVIDEPTADESIVKEAVVEESLTVETLVEDLITKKNDVDRTEVNVLSKHAYVKEFVGFIMRNGVWFLCLSFMIITLFVGVVKQCVGEMHESGVEQANRLVEIEQQRKDSIARVVYLNSIISIERAKKGLLCLACINKNDKTVAYFTEEEWDDLAKEEKSQFVKTGVSVYVNNRGLIIAPSDCKTKGGIYKYKFGGYNKNILGLKHFGSLPDWFLTSGYDDTESIIKQCKGKKDGYGIVGAPAAEAACNYEANRFEELLWYLPSVSELQLIYKNKEIINTFLRNNFKSFSEIQGAYWSSTIYDNCSSWSVSMEKGKADDYSRSLEAKVRAVAVAE